MSKKGGAIREGDVQRGGARRGGKGTTRASTRKAPRQSANPLRRAKDGSPNCTKTVLPPTPPPLSDPKPPTLPPSAPMRHRRATPSLRPPVPISSGGGAQVAGSPPAAPRGCLGPSRAPERARDRSEWNAAQHPPTMARVVPGLPIAGPGTAAPRAEPSSSRRRMARAARPAGRRTLRLAGEGAGGKACAAAGVRAGAAGTLRRCERNRWSVVRSKDAFGRPHLAQARGDAVGGPGARDAMARSRPQRSVRATHLRQGAQAHGLREAREHCLDPSASRRPRDCASLGTRALARAPRRPAGRGRRGRAGGRRRKTREGCGEGGGREWREARKGRRGRRGRGVRRLPRRGRSRPLSSEGGMVWARREES